MRCRASQARCLDLIPKHSYMPPQIFHIAENIFTLIHSSGCYASFMHSTWYVKEGQVFALCEKIIKMIWASQAQ